MNLLKEYSPKKVSEIESNREQVSKIIEFIKNFKIQKKKALLIYGPTGTGKTSHVYTIANELNLEILELNASDFRNSDSIKSIVGSASKQQSLFFKSKIILIDEVDGISGQQDRGGLQALIEVIEESSFPIIITSNDIEIEKLSSLLRKVNLLEFKPVENKTIYKILRDICDNEKINYEEKDLVEISENINGDLRAAMLDLDNFVIRKNLILNDYGIRNVKDNAYKTTFNLFNNINFLDSLNDLENSDEDIIDMSRMKVSPILFNNENSIIYLVEENIKDLDKFDILSKADLLHGRIYKQQYWRLLNYINYHLAYSSLNQPIIKVRKSFRSPKNNFKLWQLISKRRSSIVERLAKQFHCSKAKINRDIYPFLKVMLNEKIANYLNLDEDDLAYIKK